MLLQQAAQLNTLHERLNIRTKTSECSIPLSDISTILIDNPEVIITAPLLNKCAENGVALLVCDKKHIPSGIFLPYNRYFQQKLRLEQQIAFPTISAKSVWKRIVTQKIVNQSRCLLFHNHLSQARDLLQLSRSVKNGDPENIEARAAAFYFRTLFGSNFTREQPSAINSSLNYGYAIVRGVLARTLTAAGMQPCLGIHHCSQYNQFNLVDDLIEPFRPAVDHFAMMNTIGSKEPLDKKLLLQVLLQRMRVGRATYLLDDACQIICDGLSRCFEKKSSLIAGLPVLLEG